MKAIGGYFELELRKGEHYHKGSIYLHSARNCFEYILLARKYRKVYIPYYTCEALIQPLKRHHITYEFYSINENFEPVEQKLLGIDEAYLYTNYFGLKQNVVWELAKIYGEQLIIDNAQAFYSPRIKGIDTFYSPRKFFGVADGGILYTDCILNQDFPQGKSSTRMQHLLERIDEGAENGYASFRKNDDALDHQSISKMSELTDKILCGIDYREVKEQRRDNFLYLHQSLQQSNLLKLELLVDDIPMTYPYYVEDLDLRTKLIENKVFVPTYWPNVLEWCKEGDIEYELAKGILPLPIDQRYDKEDIKFITNVIANLK